MCDLYTKEVLKIILAQILQEIGWDAIDPTPMNILIDILDRYLKALTRSAQDYAELYNRTNPTFMDVCLAFEYMNVNREEIEHYMKNVKPMASVLKVPKIPIKKESSLNFLKSEDYEIQARPPHIYNYLPPMM